MTSLKPVLADLLNAALDSKGMPYFVEPDAITRMRAGSVQRSAGAASWFAMAYPKGNPDGVAITILSWDTMRACTRGLTLDKEIIDWVANAT